MAYKASVSPVRPRARKTTTTKVKKIEEKEGESALRELAPI
jgi:hypothetical protein